MSEIKYVFDVLWTSSFLPLAVYALATGNEIVCLFLIALFFVKVKTFSHEDK